MISGSWRGLYSWTLADLCGFLRVDDLGGGSVRIIREPEGNNLPNPLRPLGGLCWKVFRRACPKEMSADLRISLRGKIS